MKKLLLLLAAVGMIFTACETGGVDEGGNGTPTQSNKIATIEEQSANITATIATLQTTKSAVEATIASLKASEESATRGNDNGNNGVKTMIAALEERVEALEQMIANLTGYTQGDLTEMQDWATATFATMEQYNALASELATLKAAIAEIDGVSTAELSEALAASEKSMKQWVNEQLSGYATIADVEAQIAVLTASLTEELKAEVEKVVATLTALMNDTKQEYVKAIADAIQNQGIINEQIAKDIADINKRIDEELATINKRLDDIEKRLDEIEETIKDLVNRIQSVSYIKKYGNNPTPIETSDNGTIVTLDFEISPKETIETLALHWKNYTKVKALYSGSTDFVDMPITSFSADTEKGIITVVASCDNLSTEFFSDMQSASLRLEISDGSNDRCSEYIPIISKRWFREGIEETPANDEIYYITTDGNALEPNAESDFGAKLVSNIYNRDKGYFVLKFDGDITQIGDYAFGAVEEDNKTWTTLKYVAMPKSISYLGYYAFGGCDNLVSIDIPEGVTLIKEGAFRWCVNLSSITIPKTVTRIGTYTFWKCNSLSQLHISDLSAWCRIDFVLESELSDSKTVYANPLMKKPTLYLNGEEVVELVIPEDITELKDRVFYGFRGTKVVLHDKITRIGERAFAVNQNLVDINIPNSVKEIGENAFVSNSSLPTIAIPNTITKIENGVFSQCTSLTQLTIPDSVTSIGTGAFYKCISLANITIPESVISIEERAFEECIGELTINSKIVEEDSVDASSSPYNTWLKGAKFNSLVIGNNINRIATRAFYGCPSFIDITISNSVTKIGNYAFYSCISLTSITIPDSVTEIGDYALYRCTSLTSITIPDSVTSIGDYAFRNCSSLTNATIGNSVTEIGEYAFFLCTSLTSFVVPDSVRTIGAFALGKCDLLGSVTIGKNVSSIGGNALQNFSGELIINSKNLIESDFTSSSSRLNKCIGDSWIKASVVIGEDITKIGNYAFYNCRSIRSITIPNSVTSIGNNAFDSCNNLPSVTIPESVTALGSGIFTNCDNLTRIDIKDMSTWCKIDFSSASANLMTYGPKLYINNTAVTELTELTIPSDITQIKPYSFYNWNNLTSITIPDSVTSIGDYAFRNCSSLTNATIGNSVTEIGMYAFHNCSGLTSISIPNSVTRIGKHAFSDCSGLVSMSISNSVTEIEASTFQNCSSLKSITVPNSVTKIENYAFSGCTGLTSITIPNSVLTIGKSAFEKCVGELKINSRVLERNYASSSANLFTDALFTKVSIGDNITKLGNYLFYHLTNLTEVEMSNSITSIGDYTFANLSDMENITIPSSICSIGSSAFSGCTRLTSVNITDLSAWCMITFATPASNPVAINGAKLNLNGVEITELIIPSNITEINKYAFYKCSGLTSITLPESIVSIGRRAFMYCTATEIYCKSPTPASVETDIFSKNRPIYVPTASVEAYKTAEGWSEYADYIVGFDF